MNPTLETVVEVAAAIGMRLRMEPLTAADRKFPVLLAPSYVLRSDLNSIG